MNQTERMELAERIRQLDALSDDDKAALLALLREQKKYGIVWEEKPEEAEERLAAELPVLTEVKERFIPGATADAPNHILIEGDNLHALTALSYTHEGKIDVIYIDPPYNTGNKDFVYNDSYVDREDGYRHSKWLSFMNKRLKIAKRLLSDRGVIFISIDDNEQAQLKLLCDEVFGEDNVEQYIWCLQDSSEGSFVKTAGLTVRKEHEYILACFKFPGKRYNKYKGAKEFSNGGFSNPDNDPRGDWFSGNISRNGIKSTTGSKYYTITNPQGISFTRNWTLSEEEYQIALADNRIYFANGGAGVPRLKIFKNEPTYLIQSSLFNDVHTSVTGKNELKQIFDDEAPFNFPKPTDLIKRLLLISMDKNGIILDFFAGSGTTLHATMQLNAEDGGRRQCILVTNNENGICENVTYERNRRVIKGYTTPKGIFVDGLTDNTLRYYRTDFVPNETTIRNKRRLMALATDMLCIKNNLYCEQDEFAGRKLNKQKMRYFTAPLNPPEGGRRIDSPSMLVVYDEYVVDSLVDVLVGMDVERKIMIYVFSNTSYPHTDNFEEVLGKVELCALPSAILNAYKKICKP